jgi:hypothetical protein
MTTDYWPQEEGYIVEGSPVMMCKAGGSIGEMDCVYLSATASGCVTVATNALWGDSIGVALRSATTGQMVPVAFDGIVKLIANATIALGQMVCNAAAATAKIIDTPVSANCIKGDTGTAYILGTALQAAVTHGDEILVMLGVW